MPKPIRVEEEPSVPHAFISCMVINDSIAVNMAGNEFGMACGLLELLKAVYKKQSIKTASLASVKLFQEWLAENKKERSRKHENDTK